MGVAELAEKMMELESKTCNTRYCCLNARLYHAFASNPAPYPNQDSACKRSSSRDRGTGCRNTLGRALVNGSRANWRLVGVGFPA